LHQNPRHEHVEESIRLTVLAVLLTFTCSAGVASAPNYPNKPIRIIVPFAAGGSTDIIARMIGQKKSRAAGPRARRRLPERAREAQYLPSRDLSAPDAPHKRDHDAAINA